ncbi:MAG: tetratricopeptide repeat protein [Thermoplasmataceae archaeon]
MTDDKKETEPDMNQAEKLLEKGKFIDSLRIFNLLAQQNSGNDEQLCEIYGRMSQAYYGLEKFKTDNSLNYLEKCISLREKTGDLPGLALDFMNLAYLLDEKGDFPKASESIEKGLAVANKINDRQLELTILSAKADILSGRKRSMSEAIEIYGVVLEESKKMGDWDTFFEAEAGLVKVYREKGEGLKAEEEVNKGLKIADEIVSKIKTKKEKAEFKDVISYIYDIAVDMALEAEDVNRAMELAQKIKSI